jgi:zinc protease
MESLDKLDRKSVTAFRDTWLAPNNAALIVIGQIPQRDVMMKLIGKYFGGWAQKKLTAGPKPEFPAATRELILVDRPGSVQADIHIGRMGPVRGGPDYFPVMVGNTLLGGGASSRMFNEIREKKGYAYDAHSEYETRRDAGILRAVTQVRNDVIEPALTAVLAELQKMGKERVGATELSNTKNYITGSYLIRLETQEGLAAQLTNMKTLGLPNTFLETFTRRVRSTEPDQIQSAAAKYLDGDDAAIVVVGDASKIEEALKKFGKVSVTKAN